MVEAQTNKVVRRSQTQSLPTIWLVMETYQVGIEQCLEGTGLSFEEVASGKAELSLDQEYALYRNLLRLSNDPLLGLKLGARFGPQTLGMFGYALMSSKTIRSMIDISARFFDLSYSHFSYTAVESEEFIEVRFDFRYDLPEDLVQIFSDRDTRAAVTLGEMVGMQAPLLSEVHLAHTDYKNLKVYEEHFGCPVSLGKERNCLFIPRHLGDLELPWSNDHAMKACIESCQELLADLRSTESVRSKVVDQLIKRPGQFMAIEEIAENLGTSARSLRRKLQQEGTSYQEIVKDMRLELARQYLEDRFTVEQVAELLGYSETSAFSRAFKTWTGSPPQEYRGARGI